MNSGPVGSKRRLKVDANDSDFDGKRLRKKDVIIKEAESGKENDNVTLANPHARDHREQ